MSVDIGVAPPLGALGRSLYDRFGWPTAGRFVNVATNIAWANFLTNAERHAKTSATAALLKLAESEYLSSSTTRLLAREWPSFEAALAATPLQAFVRVALPGEQFDGDVIERSGSTMVISITADEAHQFAASTTQSAEDCGRPGFHPENIRDAFFYQCDAIASILAEAVALRRGLVLG